MHTQQQTLETASQVEEILAEFQGHPDELIPILQRVQAKLGYLPEEAMRQIARFVRVPESSVYGVATFYAQFRFKPIGRKHIMVCRGTSCYVRGAPQVLEALEKALGIKEGDVTPDLEYSLETVACIGACGLAPCIMVNNHVEACMTPQKVAQLFGKGKNDER